MKKILYITLLLPLFVIAQKNKDQQVVLPIVEGKVMYTDIITLSDTTLSKIELFNRAKAWFVTTYNSANDVLQMEDKDAGVLMGKGIIKTYIKANFMGAMFPVKVHHTVKIYLKQGKFKYELTGFSAEFQTESGWNNITVDNDSPDFNKIRKMRIMDAVNSRAFLIIESLKAAMQKPLTAKDF